MNPALLTIVQGVFTYILLWWCVFFLALQWAVPDFWFRLPWKRKGKTVYLGSARPFGAVAKKFIASSLIALIVWMVIFPLVKSDYLSFEHASHSLDHYSNGSDS